MFKNIFPIVGYACNGKSSIIPALKWNLETAFPKKKIIIIKATVVFGIKSIKIFNTFEIKSNSDYMQTLFLSSALSQFDSIKQFAKDDRFIVICDRFITDVFIFTFLHSLDEVSISQELDELLLKNCNFIDSIKFLYLRAPSNKKIVEKCLEKQIRKDTISLTNYYNDEAKFRRCYSILRSIDIEFFSQPTDNTYVLYQILNTIKKSLKGD